MIGLQWELMICKDTLEHLRVHFNFFAVDGSMEKLMSKSNFSLLSSFPVSFERVINGLGGQKLISEINPNMG